MNSLENYAVKILWTFFRDAINEGLYVGDKEVDDKTILLILNIVHDYVAQKGEEDGKGLDKYTQED